MKIGVLTVTKRPHLLPNLIASMKAQSRQPDEWRIFLHQADKIGPSKLELIGGWIVEHGLDIETYHSDARLATMRDSGFNALSHGCDVLVSYDDDDYYAPTYLQDLEESMESYPEGGIYGIQRYYIGWVTDPPLELDGGNIVGRWTSDGGKVLRANHVTWVVDATIAIRSEIWKKNPGLRFGIKPLRWICDECKRVLGDAHGMQTHSWGLDCPNCKSLGATLSESGGECEAVMQYANDCGIPIISRSPEHFCVVRYKHDDGWGGDHGHTWGPLEYRAPGSDTPPEEPEVAPESAPGFAGIMGLLGSMLDERLGAGPAQLDDGVALELTFAVRRKAAGRKLLPQWAYVMIVEDEKVPVGHAEFRLGGEAVRKFVFSDAEG